MRRTVLLDRIYKKFASPEDLRIVTDLYSRNLKGVAIRKMLQDILERIEAREWEAVKTRESEEYDIPRINLS